MPKIVAFMIVYDFFYEDKVGKKGITVNLLRDAMIIYHLFK